LRFQVILLSSCPARNADLVAQCGAAIVVVRTARRIRVSLRSLLIVVLAIVGVGALGNALLSGGSATAHGGDASVLHLCVSKAGNLKSAYVVSPGTNCPSTFYDSVHVEVADGTTPQAQTCPAGDYVTGTNADGSLVCNAFEDLFYYQLATGINVASRTAVCDPGDVAIAGSFTVSSDAVVLGSIPGDGGLVADPAHKDKWTVVANDLAGLMYSIAVCMDLTP
jgi:hypothetical protein